MSFRNPVHTIPANRITGQLTGAQIVNGAIAYPHLTGPLSSAAAVRYLDVMNDASLWENVSGAGTWGMVADSSSTTSGTVLQSVGNVSMRGRVRIPQDPDVLYRVSVRVRCTAQPGAAPNLFLGLHGFAADAVTPVNRTGANSVLTQHYVAANSATITPADGWKVFTGYVLGRANPGATGPNPQMTSPGPMHTDVRFVAPFVRVDTASTGATLQVDRVSVDVVYTGTITAENVVAGAIDGQTITGATVRTAASGRRILLNGSDGNLYFYTGMAGETGPAFIKVDGSTGSMQISGPQFSGLEYGLTLQDSFGTRQMTLDPDVVDVVGTFYADNYRTGRVTITPSAANVPTSVTVTGLGMGRSGAVRAYATASTTVPGTQVTGVGCTGAGRDGVTVWVTRTNTTATGVDWHLIGE